MVYNFLVNNLVENPNDQTSTFYINVKKLENGSYFVFKGVGDVIQKKYWNLGVETKYTGLQFKDASDKFLKLFEESIKRRLRSDVPIGTSLSGGLDSSSIVALVSKILSKNHTFSARFSNFNRDEGKYIDIVNKKYNAINHDVFISAKDFNDNLDKLIYHQEEPFQSGSIFAQYKVYEKAKSENITVMLDGQGADEYLCGYQKDFKLLNLDLFPNLIKMNSINNLIYLNHSRIVNLPLNNLTVRYLPYFYRMIRKYYDSKISKPPLGIANDFHFDCKSKTSPFHIFGSLKETLRHEMTNQGLEKLLKFADRNSMAHSVEVRLPFLSHELVEFVFELNSEFLLKDGWSKSILRNAMKDILPNEINYRKDKIGFEAPTKSWTKDKELNDLILTAKLDLINTGLITKDYSDDWKIIILYKFLNN